jgi:hypothetical protein
VPTPPDPSTLVTFDQYDTDDDPLPDEVIDSLADVLALNRIVAARGDAR